MKKQGLVGAVYFPNKKYTAQDWRKRKFLIDLGLITEAGTFHRNHFTVYEIGFRDKYDRRILPIKELKDQIQELQLTPIRALSQRRVFEEIRRLGILTDFLTMILPEPGTMYAQERLEKLSGLVETTLQSLLASFKKVNKRKLKAVKGKLKAVTIFPWLSKSLTTQLLESVGVLNSITSFESLRGTVFLLLLNLSTLGEIQSILQIAEHEERDTSNKSDEIRKVKEVFLRKEAKHLLEEFAWVARAQGGIGTRTHTYNSERHSFLLRPLSSAAEMLKSNPEEYRPFAQYIVDRYRMEHWRARKGGILNRTWFGTADFKGYVLDYGKMLETERLFEGSQSVEWVQDRERFPQYLLRARQINARVIGEDYFGLYPETLHRWVEYNFLLAYRTWMYASPIFEHNTSKTMRWREYFTAVLLAHTRFDLQQLSGSHGQTVAMDWCREHSNPISAKRKDLLQRHFAIKPV